MFDYSILVFKKNRQPKHDLQYIFFLAERDNKWLVTRQFTK